MKKGVIIGIVILILLVIAFVVYFSRVPPEIEKEIGEAPGEGAAVIIKNFNPTTSNIKTGEKITWRNEDNVLHTITMDNGLFNVDIEAGKSFTYVFNEPGIYDYHCHIHPSMKGRIVVSE